MNTEKNRLYLRTEGIVLTLNDKNIDIKKWIKAHRSSVSFKSAVGTIAKAIFEKECVEAEERSCIIHVIMNTNMDSYRLWILYDDTTSESYQLPVRKLMAAM